MSLERIKVLGYAVPIRGNDIDTDEIIPARFLNMPFKELGPYAFYDKRFNFDTGDKLNHPLDTYPLATIMIVGDNFGSGSSREHAPQSLHYFNQKITGGIQGIIAESLADIFSGNWEAMGKIGVCAEKADIEKAYALVEANASTELSIDLESMTALCGDHQFAVTMPKSRRKALMSGTWNKQAEMLTNKARVLELDAAMPIYQP